MKYLLILVVLITGSSFAGRTYDLKNRFGIGGGAGWTFPLGNGQFNDFAEDEFTYDLHMRYHMSASDALQLNFQDYEFEDTDLGANVIDLMWINRLNEYDRFTPIIGLGAGVADFHDLGPYRDDLKFAGRFRFGFEYALTDDLFASLTADYQYLGMMPHQDEDEGNDKRQFPGKEVHALVPQLNLTWFWGHDKEKGEENKAAPATVPVTAVAVAVVDTDGDGVSDQMDKCPSTAAGSTVNAYGCLPNEKANVELEILFATGNATIPPASQIAIQDLGNFMKNHPETKVEIQGHTDSTGNKVSNKALSQERANAVMTYLVEKMGIQASRITAYGYGDQQPVANNNTAEGRNKNRRVMAVISQ
jgi:outer membrane protein OmpA-like peptidoglycan-associated protein